MLGNMSIGYRRPGNWRAVLDIGWMEGICPRIPNDLCSWWSLKSDLKIWGQTFSSFVTFCRRKFRCYENSRVWPTFQDSKVDFEAWTSPQCDCVTICRLSKGEETGYDSKHWGEGLVKTSRLYTCPLLAFFKHVKIWFKWYSTLARTVASSWQFRFRVLSIHKQKCHLYHSKSRTV